MTVGTAAAPMRADPAGSGPANLGREVLPDFP
jgi:hypothetical protein